MLQNSRIKIGTDICSVGRIKGTYEKYGHRFLDKVLTDNEKDYVQGIAAKNNALKLSKLSEALAGRFAAKEAVAKALGTGWNGIYWKEVEIINAESGAPQVMLSGRAKKLFSQLGYTCAEISLSHERDYALATVLLY
jgi:holo-[acyl-carrier protein] synthase